ncbi:MAG: HAD-IB family phosphatase [Deltaproteobacteria bacterium]|nr:HAD-IB family phosphatase [Deltaproteobacteria bacterium]
MNTRLRYPLICFDLDGTLVDHTIFIWKTLHEAFQTDPVIRKEAYDNYFSQKISYKEWFATDLELLRAAGATEKRIRGILGSLKPMPGAAETLKELKRRGHILAIISGSLDIVVEHLFERNLFDHVLINKIYFDKVGQIIGGEPTRFDLEGKADGLRELARREKLPVSATAFIGDNYNDLWIAKTAGLAVAFNCKSEELREVCQVEVKERDLRGLLEIVS